MSAVPFCERNVKAWLALLGAVALVVLVMSGWIAYRGKGGVETFPHALAGGPEPSLAAQVPTSPGQTGPASPVAFVRPDMPAYGRGYGAPPTGAPVYAPPNAPPYAAPNTPTYAPPNAPPLADTVARATAGGGIRFVGRATMPNADHGNAFNRAATAIRPAVVAIAAIRYAPVAPTQNPNAVQFLDPYDGIPDRFIGQKSFEAVGSGVVVDPSGLIVTNDHVIHGAGVVYASLPSAPEIHLPAQVVVSDPNIDLALLKITTSGPMQVATLGDSSQVDIGDWVLAVGYPFGLQLTVTSGIVGGSRVALNIGGQSYSGLIQTDAPINKGSSGGPLVNLRGEVIGINTAIYAPTGVFSGTGFAIPSNRVGAFVARHTQRSATLAAATQPPSSMTATWLGLGLVDVSPDLAAQLRFPYAGGAYVASVVLDSPAEDAEVIRGDIVTSLAGQPVTNVDSVMRILQALSPGQVVPITVWRGNKTVTTMMRLRGA